MACARPALPSGAAWSAIPVPAPAPLRRRTARTYSRPSSRMASHATVLLPPFPMQTAFPSSEYYGGSVTPRAHQRTSRLTGRHQRPAATGVLPTFTMIRLTGSAVGFTPAAHPKRIRSIAPATGPGSMSRAGRDTPIYNGAILAADVPRQEFETTWRVEGLGIGGRHGSRPQGPIWIAGCSVIGGGRR